MLRTKPEPWKPYENVSGIDTEDVTPAMVFEWIHVVKQLTFIIHNVGMWDEST